MAEKYITFMKSGLKEFFKDKEAKFKNDMKGTYGWEGVDAMYEYLAWEGLLGTIAYSNYENKDKQRKFIESGNTNYLPKDC